VLRKNDRRADRERDCDPNAGRDEQPRRIGKHHEQFVQPRLAHVHRLLVREPLRDAARHAEHTERCDERHHFQTRDH
jgi:hypothetical protein